MDEDLPNDLALLIASYVTIPIKRIVRWLPSNRNAWLKYVPENLSSEMCLSWLAYNPNLVLKYSGPLYVRTIDEIDWATLLHNPAMFDTLKQTVFEITEELSQHDLTKAVRLMNYPHIDESFYISNPNLFEILVEPTKEKLAKNAELIQNGQSQNKKFILL